MNRLARDRLSRSKHLYTETITLSMYPALTKAQQQEVVQKFNTPIDRQTVFFSQLGS